jgi:hypothetical protein
MICGPRPADPPSVIIYDTTEVEVNARSLDSNKLSISAAHCHFKSTFPMAAIRDPNTMGPTDDVDDLISRILKQSLGSPSEWMQRPINIPTGNTNCISDRPPATSSCSQLALSSINTCLPLALIHPNHQNKSPEQSPEQSSIYRTISRINQLLQSLQLP